MSEGVNANWQRLIFMLLLALFTVLALRAVGLPTDGGATGDSCN